MILDVRSSLEGILSVHLLILWQLLWEKLTTMQGVKGHSLQTRGYQRNRRFSHILQVKIGTEHSIH